MTKSSTTFKFIVLVSIVLLAGVELFLRGPLRVTRAGDFASTYVSTLQFIHGQNPYSPKDFLVRWHAAGAPQKYSLDDFIQHPIYPPTALVIFAPLAKLSWPWALRCYTWSCTLGYLGLIWLLARLVADSWRSLSRLGFVAFALAISPIQAAITQGNVSAMAFILCGYALYLAYFRDQPISGILLAVAFCAKPTTAIAAVGMLLLCRRTKSMLAFVCVSGFIAGVAAVAMLKINAVWKIDYQGNLHMLFGHNGAADFASDSTGHFDLVNLQVPLFQMFSSVRLANFLAVAIATVLLVVWFSLFRKDSDTRSGSYWLAAGSLCLIALMPVYQRNYNAGVILFVAVWAFDHIREVYGRAALLASVAFLFPGEAILRNTHLDDHLNRTWRLLLLPQLTWSVLAVTIICCLYRARSAEFSPAVRQQVQ